LIDGRHLAAQKWPVERIFRALTLDGYKESLVAGGKLAENGIGELAIHLDVLLPGERITVLVVNGPAVTKNSTEDVGEKVGEEFLFFECVGLWGPKQPSPAAQGLLRARDGAR
jgi:hypothetical protein